MGGGDIGAGGGGGFGLSSIYVKKDAATTHLFFRNRSNLYSGHFAYKWKRELDHLHHTAKDNGFNFSFTIHNNNGFNHMI